MEYVVGFLAAVGAVAIILAVLAFWSAWRVGEAAPPCGGK